MSQQYSAHHRTNAMTQLATDVGINAQVILYSGSMPAAASVPPTGTLLVQFAGNATQFGLSPFTLSGVTITGTAGQFSCSASAQALAVGVSMILSGTYGGTGSISGYSNPTTYWVVATNGSTTFTLSTTQGGSGVTTTAGTPTGITYTVEPGILYVSAIANAVAAGGGAGTNAGYYRINTSAGVAVAQGLCFNSVALVTSSLTAANGNVLNFAATTGVSVGMSVSGTGILPGTSVIAVGGTTVTLSQSSTAGVASSATITFAGDMTLTNLSIATGQTVAFTSMAITAFGA